MSRFSRAGGMLHAASRVAPAMFLTAALNGAVAVVTARQLGADGRGALAIVATVVSLVSIVVALGLNSAGRYHLASPVDPMPLGPYLGLSLVLVTVNSLMSGIAGYLGYPVTGVNVDLAVIAATAAYGAAFMLAWQSRDAVNAYGFNARAALHSAAGSFVAFVAMVCLSLRAEDDFLPYLWALVAGAVFEVILHLRKLGNAGKDTRPSASWREWSVLMRRGIPAMGLAIGQSVSFRVDRYILGAFLGPATVGIYSVAATVSELLRLVPTALGQVAFFKTASLGASRREVERARNVMLLLMLPPLLVMAVLAPQIVEWLFGTEFRAAAVPLRILLIGELAIMSFQIDSRILGGLGATKSAGVVGLLGLACVLVSDLLLIPRYGMVGAAWASVLTYFALGFCARLALKLADKRSLAD